MGNDMAKTKKIRVEIIESDRTDDAFKNKKDKPINLREGQ
jgi:hypothetical protein